MNVRRFTARTSRDALVLVRQALGEDAVVLSTKPCADGIEVLAMAPEGMRQVERYSQAEPAAAAAPARGNARPDFVNSTQAVEDDVAQLSMSTLSFQDYVRERMLKRRHAAMNNEPRAAAPVAEPAFERTSVLAQRMSERAPAALPAAQVMPAMPAVQAAPVVLREPPLLRDNAPPRSEIHVPDLAAQAESLAIARRDQQDMMNELRQVKGLIEERFGALAFIEKLQRQPGQARLTQKLLDCGYSPALIRKLGDSLPQDVADESTWATSVLERNLITAEHDAPLEDQGGVYALVGATGVGKTTTTAKIAAAFATKYGAANLGLITLDAYRIGAHEQLRAYGRILGVPVHTAHDRASLEDLLELLAGKKMVLIDTAGMAQRDTRTRELLDMLSHRSIQKLLVVNAASQGETVEDVLIAYRATACAGIVLSKMDEAVKLGPALDALIRHKLKVIGVANGQRVPEDWHRLSANALVHRSMRGGGSTAYKLDASDVSLIFTAAHGNAPARSALHA
ncbi:MAG: flagellar biosynthesis protein FlhF [Burkholderiales bacterium]